MRDFEDNEKNDFFEDASEEPVRAPEPKRPEWQPDDPRYWEEPEDEFEHLRPSPGMHWRFWLWVGVGLISIVIVWVVYSRMFNPYVDDATQYGYVESIEKRGEVFKTFEGVVLPYKNLMDTTRSYDGDFVFSTSDPKVAAKLKEMQFANMPVRITYRKYHTAMPWRGASPVIVVKVDSVNERNILPPDRQPSYLKK